MKNRLQIVILSALVFTFFSCKKDQLVSKEEDKKSVTPGEGLEDWTTATHSNSGPPNYEVVFNQELVNRIDIVLTTEEYNTMQTDLKNLVSSNGGGPGGSFSDENAVYIACDFFFNGVQWYNVGLRYKGNSSLYSSYQRGIGKLPLRLKFDKFEEEYPEIKNQRFYGFKDLSLSSNFDDPSCMREKAASDLFREFGVPASQSAFYQVYVDEGDGPKYYGLYTMVEVVYDALLNNHFGSELGNCYKPDGDGAKFAANGFDLNDFEKKTNSKAVDWSDIQELYDIIHSTNRTTNVEKWKSDLEKIFDVHGFLKYLAVNNTIENWDTYGNMSHNYYLYHDPADDLIKWIVWDNNEAFKPGKKSGSLSFGMNEVGNDWPLISYLIAIEEYKNIYHDYIESFIENNFEPVKMSAHYSKLDNLISSSVNSEIDGFTFKNQGSGYAGSVSELKIHCEDRVEAAHDYLK